LKISIKSYEQRSEEGREKHCHTLPLHLFITFYSKIQIANGFLEVELSLIYHIFKVDHNLKKVDLQCLNKVWSSSINTITAFSFSERPSSQAPTLLQIPITFEEWWRTMNFTIRHPSKLHYINGISPTCASIQRCTVCILTVRVILWWHLYYWISYIVACISLDFSRCNHEFPPKINITF